VRRRVNITHVVTAGSPVGRFQVPDDVQVLALENSADLVPRLDGTSNPEDANITTVTCDADRGSAGENHELQFYGQLADRLPRDDPSVQAWRTGAGGFLDPGNRVVSHEHERQTISREPAP
jgi:hypothetical protein